MTTQLSYHERLAQEIAGLSSDELRRRAGDALKSAEHRGNIEMNLLEKELKRRGMRRYSAPRRPRPQPAQAGQNRSARLDGLPDIPDGWHPSAHSDEWTPQHETWLTVCLTLLEDFDDFNPRALLNGRAPGPHAQFAFRFLREEAELSQQQLADRLGVNQATLSRWEQGVRIPDSEDYFAFLRETADKVARSASYEILRCVALRDGWGDIASDDPAHTDALKNALDYLHEPLFRPGGLFDRWRETGSLPAWTPRDAGLSD